MEASEHAVIATFALTGDGFGEPAEREAARELQRRLTTAIASAGVGEFDGNEFGGGQVVLYAYGPDADRLFATMEPHLREFPGRPATAVLRFGAASDPAAPERHIQL